jgi:phospholipase/lecithinase/hemolysin
MKKIRFTTARGRLLAYLLPVLMTLAPAGARAQNTLSTSPFLVIGEGLAAGMADFALRDVYQKGSFPAVMAAQMNTAFLQPLIQPPGISAGAPGFATLPGGFPLTLQGSVREDFPPGLFVFNLATPGATLSDAINYAPASPLIQINNPKQTMTNLILGYPALIIPQTVPLWSQLNYAVAMNPTLVVVELGFYEVLNAAVNNDPKQLPNVATFASNYATVLSRLKASNPQIVVMTIPDPFDTAFFTSVNSAPQYLAGAPPSALAQFLAMGPNDYITPNGLLQAGTQLLLGTVNPYLAPFSAISGTTVSAATQAAVATNLAALNAAITNAAKEAGTSVVVFDLQALLHQVKTSGLPVGSTTLTANYLGGFYSLDGYYPGQTGQAYIANQMLSFLNSTYKTNFPLVNLATVSTSDPALRARPTAITSQTLTNPRGVPLGRFDQKMLEGLK